MSKRKMTFEEWVSLTLSPIERESPRALAVAQAAYRAALDHVSLYDEPDIASARTQQ